MAEIFGADLIRICMKKEHQALAEIMTPQEAAAQSYRYLKPLLR